LAQARFAFMPHDADYYRARAIEQRGWAHDAARDEIAVIHRELAQQYERLAEHCDGVAEEFDSLAERASHIIKERTG
jgi:hypothetical protein